VKLNTIFKIPFVATKHNSRKGRVFEKLENVIAVSDAVAASIHSAKIVQIITNGIIPKNITPIGSKKFMTIGAVGRLDPIKGFDNLILAMKDLPNECILEIVGEGPQYKDLKNLIEQNGLSKRVSLLGFCDDVPDFMSKCDVVVVSSHSEGFSRVLIEGMWYAPILVTTPVGGSSIYPSDFLIQNRDFEKKLKNIHGDYEAQKTNFRAWADSIKEQYALQAVVQEHEKLYKSILK
jgi:glycosyltransferase involved in cell wall biosynthesis